MIGPIDVLHPPPAPHFKTFQVFLIYCPKLPKIITWVKNWLLQELNDFTVWLVISIWAFHPTNTASILAV
jgi:hypothetical protein